MEWLDIGYKVVAFLVVPLMWQLKTMTDSLNSIKGAQSALSAKLEKMMEESERDHKMVEKSIHQLEGQHATHEKDQAKQQVKIDEILNHVRCKSEDK